MIHRVSIWTVVVMMEWRGLRPHRVVIHVMVMMMRGRMEWWNSSGIEIWMGRGFEW